MLFVKVNKSIGNIGAAGVIAAGILSIILSPEVSMVRAERPSPEMLEARKNRIRQVEKARNDARPWADALGITIRKESFYDKLPADGATTLAQDVRKYTFLATYKQYDPKKHRGAALNAWADEFGDVWKVLGKKCRKAGLDQALLAETIYQITNSDWEPVSCGRNWAAKDDLATGNAYRELGEALIELALKAGARGKEYRGIWDCLPRGGRVGSPADVRNVDVNDPPRPPKW